MKNFIKQSCLFYGVVILLILFLFVNPANLTGLTKAQYGQLGSVYGYFAISFFLCIVSLGVRSHLYAKVRYGAIKSIEDSRYSKRLLLVDGFMVFGLVNLGVSFFYQLPKLIKLMNTGILNVLGGETPLKFSIWGLIIIAVAIIYAMIGNKLMEEDLPRRRRGVKRIRISIGEFIAIFIPHIPAAISFLIYIAFLVNLNNLVK